jgi:hypothetical protein
LNVRSQYEAKKAQDERRAQERQPIRLWWLGQREPMARFSKWLAVLTFFLVIATVVNVVILNRTDEKIGVQLAALYNQERPYVFVETPKIAYLPAAYPADRNRPQLEYGFKNYGKTPAIVIFWIAEAHTIEKPNEELWSEIGTQPFILGDKEELPAKPRYHPGKILPKTGELAPHVMLSVKVLYQDFFGFLHYSGYYFLRMPDPIDRFEGGGRGDDESKKIPDDLLGTQQALLDWAKMNFRGFVTK